MQQGKSLGTEQAASKDLELELSRNCRVVFVARGGSESEAGNGQHSGPRSRDRAWLGLHRGLGEKPGSCCGYEAGLAGERKGQAGQDRVRAAGMGRTMQSEDSSEDRAWALTIGLTHTTKDAMCLFCGASYRADMPITHHGGLARGVKSGPSLTV